jgi:hypothetical protein
MSRGIFEFLKMEKSPILKEETGGRRSRSLGEKYLKGLQGENKGSSRSREGRLQSRPLDMEGNMAKDQCITDSQSKEAESREDKTREVQTRDLITVIDYEKNEDRISGPEAFTDSEIEQEEKATRRSPEVQVHEKSWPTVIFCGHINEES